MPTATRSQIWKLLDPLIDKIFGGTLPPPGRWGIQVKYEGADDVEYENIKKRLEKQDLINHFSQQTTDGVGSPEWNNYKPLPRKESSLGFMLEQRTGDDKKCRLFCVDADEPEHMAYLPQFLDVLKKHDIEHIYEFAGANLDRAHIWLCVDSETWMLKSWVEHIFKEAEINWRAQPRLELFGSHKPNSLIRFLGGHHQRAGCANPIVFRNKKSKKSIVLHPVSN